MSPSLLYVDHHATTPIDPEVLAEMQPWLQGLAANASSVHAPGRAARQAVEKARSEVARALGASPEEVVFTSGGTEADNLAVRGGAAAAREAAPRRTRVLFSAAEHSAVREAARALRAAGFTAVEIPVDRDGLPGDGLLAEPLDVAALLSLILANNETGAINDSLASQSARARAAGVVVHTDAVQAVGKIPVDVNALGVDLLSLTAHKFGGPKGAGALYVRHGVRVTPQAVGGGQEKGRRAGTENVPALVGLGAAVRVATGRLAAEAARLGALRDRFEEGLRAAMPEVRFNATARPAGRRLATVTSAVFPGADGETMLAALDLEGIAASAGSACASGTTKPSAILTACGLSAADVRATLRFSFGRTTRDEDIDRLLETIPRIAARQAAIARA